MSEKIEERSVELSELESGIQLRAGHEVLLIVSGATGTRRRKSRKPADKFHIHLQLHAAGGTPLAGEKVRIHDPETGEQVATATTDDKGVLEISVPAEKDYHVFVDDEPAEQQTDEFSGALQGAPREPDRHAVLWVALVDAKGAPLKGEKVQIKGEEGAAQESETDDQGCINMVVEPGVFTLEVRGKSLVAHSIFHDDPIAGDGAPYKFVLR
jgi:hypothetical protein